MKGKSKGSFTCRASICYGHATISRCRHHGNMSYTFERAEVQLIFRNQFSTSNLENECHFFPISLLRENERTGDEESTKQRRKPKTVSSFSSPLAANRSGLPGRDPRSGTHAPISFSELPRELGASRRQNLAGNRSKPFHFFTSLSATVHRSRAQPIKQSALASPVKHLPYFHFLSPEVARLLSIPLSGG